MLKYIVCFTLLGSTSFAAENSVSASLKPGSSAANRADKNNMLLGSIGVGALPTYGATVGFYMDPSSILEIGLNQGEWHTRNGLLNTNESQDSSTTQVSLSYKNFISNSFYAKAGIGYRRTSHKYEYSNKIFGIGNSNSPRDSYEFTGSTTAGLISIGNQWQFSNYTIGCDWVTAWLPVTSSVESEKVTLNTTRSASFTAKDMENDQDQFLRKSNLMISFYMGASF